IEVWALWLLGTMFRESDRLVEARDTLKEAAALAKSLEMRLHSAYCHEALAEVSDQLEQSDEAVEARDIAERILKDCGGLGRLVRKQQAYRRDRWHSSVLRARQSWRVR